jgi:hypothetical protein
MKRALEWLSMRTNERCNNGYQGNNLERNQHNIHILCTHTHMHKFAVNLVFQKKDTSISFTEEIKKQSVYK